MYQTRRSFIKLAGASSAIAALGISAPSIGQSANKISFTTSWLPEGPNLFAYVARDKGFWKSNGLDVTVARGSGSGPTAQAVGANTFMFGMGAAPTVMIQAAKGLPITSIAQLNYDALMGVGVLANSPIKTPKDLEGKKLGASVGSGEYPFLPLYAKKAGFDFSKVTLVQLDSKVRDRSLIEKLVDGVAAFGSSTIPSLSANGVDVRFMLFKAVGLEFYGQSLITQTARLKAEPAMCQAFVNGAMQAIQFVMTNPEEALAIFLKANDEVAMTSTGKKYAEIGLGLTNLTNIVPEVTDNGLGWADPAKMKSQAEIVLEFAAGKGAKLPEMSSLFTNQFAGKIKLSEAQLMQAKKMVDPYRKYVA